MCFGSIWLYLYAKGTLYRQLGEIDGTKYTDPDSAQRRTGGTPCRCERCVHVSLRADAGAVEKNHGGGGTGRLDREPASQKAWTF